MVNSGSFDAAGSEGESVKAEFTQLEDDAAEASLTAVVPEDVATSKPKPNPSLQCSVPLDKVKNVLKSKLILDNYIKQKTELGDMPDASKKRLMCLFCDRTFTSNNLKQKHVDRCHSAGQTRRSSSRTPNHSQSATACCFCSKLNHTDHTLKQLLEHLINEHSNRYYACLPCQERFSSIQTLREHNRSVHGLQDPPETKTPSPSPVTTSETSSSEVIRPELKRTSSNESTSSLPATPKENSSLQNSSKPQKKNSSLKNITTPETKQENVGKDTGFHQDFEDAIHANIISQEDAKKLKQSEDDEDLVLARRVKNGLVNSKTRNTHKKNQVGNKKISVKSTKNGLRNLRTTRASVKQITNNFTKNRKKIVKHESEPGKEITKRHVPNPASVFSLVNAYIYKYEKIYDHASDSIKDANSVQFNAVFDREFYSRTVCNIRENLLHHLDGKLNRNVESENRISNFEHPATVSEAEAKPANDAVDNFGCDLSLNAVTPVATLLGSSQYGEDLDAQIEYGAKASQKKPKKVTVVKYKFPNKKYNTIVQEKDSQSDLTCLDMWTQLSVKKRQHRFNGDINFTEDLRNYKRPTGELKVQVDELNKILDTRGPFEDLRLEANAHQFLELRKKSAKEGDYISEESSKDVYFVIEDLLNRVMCKISENTVPTYSDIEEIKDEKETEESKLDVTQNLELPSYLQLQRSPAKSNEFKMDKTDSIAMICASQDESEMKENKRMELTGEWTRPRIYICATCGLKLPNLKSLDDHKNVTHPHIWCSHYEFVGSQSQIYRHLSIPGLGKIGIVEKLPLNRQWQRSDARMCSKCSKQCHNLGELHKHILECGGDWTWMLARKKCKYRPYGARTRRRRQRGYKRSCNPEVNRAREHKPKIKPLFIGPRPKPSKPSDAETIERMLANLPPKRHRKMISMRDGIQRPRKAYKQKLNPSSSNSKTNSSPKLTNKKVHFKNNSPQISKQTIRNALKRKISANNLRKPNKNDSETDSSDTPLILRSKIKKDNDESDIKQKLIGKRNNIRNKRMISRILGSKIFDSNSALITRRKLAKAIAQTNLIRKTRLRSKMQSQQAANKLKEDEIDEEPEEKLPSKNRSFEKSSQDNDKKTKIIKNNNDETDSKLTKKEVESDAKPKKSNTKRFLSVLTKSNKKTKIPEADKDKPDTITAIIDDVISRAIKNEAFELKFDTKDQREKSRKTRNSLLKVDPTKIKSNEGSSTKKTNNNPDEVKNNKNDGKIENVIPEKKNKLVQNVKSFRKSFRNKNKTGEKSEGIASKLIRTLSIKGSKKKKIAAKNETKSQKSNSSDTNDQKIELKKTTSEVLDQSKEHENKNIPELESTDKICDIEDSSKTNADSEMPTLEKIEPLPSHVSLNNSANSIPILCPVNINPSESDTSVEKDKETKSDSDVCSDNKTDLKSCDKSSASNCNSLNKFKNKIKRSGRGLNDCIAMLKCKLEQKQQTNIEPSLIDKSNLFILNSTEVNKHSQPVVQEKIDVQEEIDVQEKVDDDKKKIDDKDLHETVDVQEKVDVSRSDADESTKINAITISESAEKDETIDSTNLEDNKLPENASTSEAKNEPKKPERNVLEIPSFKINISTTEISTVETQTQTVDEDIVPNAAIDFMPTNIETNFQLSYVLNATLQNCLMECVKNKCEELKIENQNLKSNKPGNKIGSVRKRIPKANTITKEKRASTSRKPKTDTLEKPIPNIPVLLNTAFTEISTPENVTKKSNSKSRSNSKAASDTSDDDIPLSKFISDSSSTKLKIKLPVAKKKRSSKKHIAFTPLILNNQDSHIPQVSLQERLEQRISLDNSMNNETEEIQKEVARSKEKVSEIHADANINNVENVTSETDIKNDAPQIISDMTNKEETLVLNKELEKVIENTPADINEELPTEIKLPECKNVNIEEPISDVNNEKQDIIFNQDDVVKSNEIISETPKEVLQENIVNVNSTSKDENVSEIVNIKESAPSKDVLESFQPLSQQIMAMEDEQCDSFLINKTLTEANTKPSTPTKNMLQNSSLSESVDDQSNHFDSGKENTECQDMLKPKRIAKRTKKKRGRSKVNNLSEEIVDSSLSTDMDQSIEKLVENYDTSIENIAQLAMEDTSTPIIKVKRKRGRAKKIQSEITESDISTTDLDTTEKTEDVSTVLTEDVPQNTIDAVKIKKKRGRRKTIHIESENSESDNLTAKELEKTENIESLSEDPFPKVSEELIKPVRKRGRRKKVQPEINETTDSALPTDSEAETTVSKELTKNIVEEIKPKGRRGRRKKSEILALTKLIDSELETTDNKDTPNESSFQNEDKQVNSENEERNIENVQSEIIEPINPSKPVDTHLEITENKEILNENSPSLENTATNDETTNIENIEPKIIEPNELPTQIYLGKESAEIKDIPEDSSVKLNEQSAIENSECSDDKMNEDIVKPKKKRGRKKKVELQQSKIVETTETVPINELHLTQTLEDSACDISTNDTPIEENISKIDEQLITVENSEIENIPNDESSIPQPADWSEKIDTSNTFNEEKISHKNLEENEEIPTETNTIVVDNKNEIENEQSVINESISDVITDLNELIKENENTNYKLPIENTEENVQQPEETSVKVKKKRGRKKKIQSDTEILADVSTVTELNKTLSTSEIDVSNIINEEIGKAETTRTSWKRGRKKKIQPVIIETTSDISTNMDTTMNKSESDLSNIVNEEIYNIDMSEKGFEKRGRPKRIQPDVSAITDVDKTIDTGDSDISFIVSDNENESTSERKIEKRGRKKKIQPENNENVIDLSTKMDVESLSVIENIAIKTVSEEIYIEGTSETTVEKPDINEPITTILDKTGINENNVDKITEEIHNVSTSEEKNKKRGRKKKVQTETFETVDNIPRILGLHQTKIDNNILSEEINNQDTLTRPIEKRGRKKKIQYENNEDVTDISPIADSDRKNEINLNIFTEEIYNESTLEKSNEELSTIKNSENETDHLTITVNNIVTDQIYNEDISKRKGDKRGRKKKISESVELITDISSTINLDKTISENENEVSTILTEQIFNENTSEKLEEKLDRNKKVLENTPTINDVSTIPNFDESVSKSESDLNNTFIEEIYNKSISERPIDKRGRKKKVQVENIEPVTDLSTITNLDTSLTQNETDVNNILSEEFYNEDISERTVEKRGRKKKALRENIEDETDSLLNKSEINLSNTFNEEIYTTIERTDEKRPRKKKVQNETVEYENNISTITNLDKTLSKSENDLSNMLEEDMEDVAEITGETTITIRRNRGRRKTINIEFNTATDPIIDTSIEPNVNQLVHRIENINNIPPINNQLIISEDALQKPDESIKIKKKRGRKKSVYIQIENTELNTDESVAEINQSTNLTDSSNINSESSFTESASDETITVKRKRGRRKSTYIPNENEFHTDVANSADNVLHRDLATDDTQITDKPKRKRGRRKTVHLDEEINEIIDNNPTTVQNFTSEEPKEISNIPETNPTDAVDGTVIEDSRPKRKRSRTIVYTEPDIEDPIPEISTVDTDHTTENTEVNKSEIVGEKRKRSRAKIYIEDKISEISTVNTNLPNENTEVHTNLRTENTEVLIPEPFIEKRKRSKSKIYTELEIDDPIPEISTVENLIPKIPKEDIDQPAENTEVNKFEIVVEKRKRIRAKIYIEPNIENPIPEISTVDTNHPPENTEVLISEPVCEKRKRSRSKIYTELEIDEPIPEISAVEDSIPEIPTEDIDQPAENTEVNKPEIVVEKRKRSRAKIYIEDPVPEISTVNISQPIENTDINKPETAVEKRKRSRTKIYIEPEIDNSIPEIFTDDIDQSVENTEVNESEISVETVTQITAEDFRLQLQSSVENEPETSVMENKNIQEPPFTDIPAQNTPVVTEQNSDSEDELPLAILFKNKKDNNSLHENMEFLESETNKFELDISVPPVSQDNIIENINNNSEENETLNISTENTLNVPSSENQEMADLEEEAKLEDEVDENIDSSNNNEDLYEFIEEEMEKSSENVADETDNNENMVNEEAYTEIQDTINKQTELLETHFDLENNVKTESRNIKLESLNIKDEVYVVENANILNTPIEKQFSENQSSFITTPDLADKSLVIKIKTNFNVKIKKPKKTRRRVIPKSLTRCNIKRKEKDDDEVRLVAICEICNKTFKRKENLASHKRTLTHIAKLSEIEAKETLARKINEEAEENKDDEVNEEQENLEYIPDHENENIQIEVEPDISELIENLEPVANNINSNVETIIPDIENKELILGDAEMEEFVNENSNLNEIKNNLLMDIQEQSSDNVIPLENKETIDDELSIDSRQISKESENFINNDESNIVQPVEEILDIKSQTQAANLIPELNTNLKLVDIISEVLDKPVNELICDADYLPQNIRRSSNNCDSNDKYSEPKRYKSLGERKSFDSDNYNSTSKCNDEIKETYNTSLGSLNNGLLSKQLSLLENIIEETNPNLNYIDDSISLSSNHFDEPVEHNISEKDLFKPEYNKLNASEIKFSHTADVLSSLMKPNNRFNNFQHISDSFAKPTKQVEEITNQIENEVQMKSVKDNSKRKILNRDEELFLECCSLLKSGSEISSVSKKSTKKIPLNSFSRSNDASWIIQKQPNSDQFIQRDSYSWLAQSSRVDTPIGEPFVNNDWSNSNSAVSSEWLAQKAPSPDRPIESNTLMKKTNNNSGETKYSDIQFEDISIDTSLETSKTLMAIDNSSTENIPLDFHHVDFSNKNLIEMPEVQRENSKSDDLEIDPFMDINDNSENTTSSSREISGIRVKTDIFLKPTERKSEENVFNNEEFDPDLKKKVVSAFGGLMAKALSNRLHAVVRKTKKAKGKRDFDSAIQASITDYAVPVKKNKLNCADSDSNDCPKKLITKGAMKVFEGLKVSIPTQDLNLKEVLNCSNKPKNGETEAEHDPIIEEVKETTILEKSNEKVIESTKNGKLKNLFSRFGNKLGLKETKKKASKHRSKSKNQTEIKKPHDVYDFEESLDSNMFKAGKFSLFRNRDQNFETSDADTSKKTDDDKMDDTKHNHESGIGSLKWNGNESDSDTDRYYDSMSFEEMSLSSESTHGSDLNVNKIKPVQKKTVDKSKDSQKKCMIMGRIFKNASKPKLEDKIPEIRDISSEENSKLVENYIDSYSSVDNVESTVHHELPPVPNNVTVVNNAANKMSKIEMDLLFDKLLQEEKKHEEMSSTMPIESEQISEQVENNIEPIHIEKNSMEKKKVKEGKSKIPGKIKKRQRYNSGDSTSSDEFTIGNRHSKSSKKHHKTPRKSTKPKKDTGINLEQEIKECIGVAGRKSQRKCTSGKQNVLIEFWSSDESSFEEVIKMLEKENEPVAPMENKNEETEPPLIEPEEPLLNNSNSNSKEDLPVAKIIESIPKNNIDIYEFESDIEPKQDALKIKIKLTDPNLKSETNFIASTKIKIPKKTKRIGKSRKHSKSHGEESDDTEFEIDKNRKREHKRKKSIENGDASMLDQNPDCLAVTRKKRNAGDQLYYWSSSSDDEFQDLIEVKPIREDTDDDRPMQHGWIVGDSPKKLVTMLAQAKGKKVEGESVKEQGKKNRVTL